MKIFTASLAHGSSKVSLTGIMSSGSARGKTPPARQSVGSEPLPPGFFAVSARGVRDGQAGSRPPPTETSKDKFSLSRALVAAKLPRRVLQYWACPTQ
jgi:hypothetical protein